MGNSKLLKTDQSRKSGSVFILNCQIWNHQRVSTSTSNILKINHATEKNIPQIFAHKFKFCQTVTCISIINQFHEFSSNQIFGGFLSFGPILGRSWPPTLPSRARATTPRRQRSPCLSSVLWPLSVLWLIQALLPTG